MTLELLPLSSNRDHRGKIHNYICILFYFQDCPELDLTSEYRKMLPKHIPKPEILKDIHTCFIANMSKFYPYDRYSYTWHMVYKQY